MAAWFIDDFDQTRIFITDTIREYYIPKFRITMTVDEPYLYLTWNDREKGTGGDQRTLTLNYLDVVDNYSGYVDNPSSATDLMAQIEAMIISGWTDISGGGTPILTSKGDLLTHNGVGDVIHPAGPDRSLVGYDSSNSDGLEDYTTAQVVADGLAKTDTDTIDITLTSNSISAVANTQMSVTSDASGLKLSGDATTPGNYKSYGTSSAGTKGWYGESFTIGYSGSVSSTNTSAQELIWSVLIPAGTLAAGDAIQVTWCCNKSVGSGNFTSRVRLHTSNAVGGTAYTTMAYTGVLKQLMETNIIILTATSQIGSPINGISYGQYAIANSTSALNVASDMWVIITSEKATSTDTTNLEFATVHIKKYRA